MRFAFIGGGNMATALIGGMIANGRPPGDFVVVEPYEAQRQRLAQRFAGIDVRADIASTPLRGVALAVLAVKPQQMHEACAALASRIPDIGAVLSIAAGTRIATISQWLGGFDRIVRAMPNTPALVRAGISGVYAPPSVDAAGREAAATVLEAAGEVLWCDDEAMLDAVTGVSSSGAAYVFYFIEALEAAATRLGFAGADARRLAYATFDGAIRLARASDVDAKTLRAQVTSKGGTTERGVAALEQANVAEAIVRAATAATERARELGEPDAGAKR
jgi:pyrroline-5-carboxylate reductase